MSYKGIYVSPNNITPNRDVKPMVDVSGKVLCIGDKVAIIDPSHERLIVGNITKITSVVEVTSDSNNGNVLYGSSTQISKIE